MTPAFAEIAFTPLVKAEQQRDGSRASHASGFEADAQPFKNSLGPAEADFIARLQSFHRATVSETGWPHGQHPGPLQAAGLRARPQHARVQRDARIADLESRLTALSRQTDD